MTDDNIINIEVKSSKGDTTYTVSFAFDGNRMSVNCSCPAGIYGQICKHRISLLKGETTYLLNENDMGKLQYIVEWVKNSEYISYLKDLVRLERSLEKAKKKLKQFKADFAEDMKIGISSWDEN